MATILKKENVILRESNESKIKELEAIGYKKVTEAELKAQKKKAAKPADKKADDKKETKK